MSKGKGTLFLKVAIVLFATVFFGYQIFSIIYKPITTATAVYYDDYDGIDINGYFVREEQIIDYNPTGAERYVASEGEKVSFGGTIAEVYSDAATAAAYARADELKEQITTLNAMNSVSDPSSVDLDTINNKIKNAYIELLGQNDNGCFLKSETFSNELLLQMNRKQIITGEVSGFDSLISSLQNEVSTLTSGLSAPEKTITANTSGFFVSNVDGLEDVLSISKIDSFDTTIFDKIENTEAASGFGKIVTSYDWYIISKMTGDDYLNFSEGDKVTLKTPIEGLEDLTANVYKVNVTQGKDEALVIFSCNMMNGEIAVTRNAKMTVVTDSYSGIKISNKAIRVLDGQTGVYIIQGSVVKFRPVEIIHTTDTYSLCKKDETGSTDAIRLYDEVIEKGKNLYDGKYIN